MNRVMFRVVGVLALVAATLASNVARADVPKTMNHQGVISVNGVRFDGTGYFKFAIVNGAGVTVWTNDGTHTMEVNGIPNSEEPVPVVNGVYSIVLGDTNAPYFMPPINAELFGSANMVLRIWFNDTVNLSQLLIPDQPLTSSPYSFQAELFQPPIGSIVAWHKNIGPTPLPIPDGWMDCNGDPLPNDSPLKTVYGATNTPNLNGPARFLRGASSSGALQGDAFQGHWHRFDYLADNDLGGTPDPNDNRLVKLGDLGTNTFRIDRVQSPVTDTLHGEPRVDSETRPINMSVVWIMRVK